MAPILNHHSFTRLHIIHLLAFYSHISHYRCRHAHQLTTITTFTHGRAERRLHDDFTRRTRDGDDVLGHRLSALIVPEPGRRTLIRVRPRGRWRRSSWILHRKREHGLTTTADCSRIRSIRTRQNSATNVRSVKQIWQSQSTHHVGQRINRCRDSNCVASFEHAGQSV